MTDCSQSTVFKTNKALNSAVDGERTLFGYTDVEVSRGGGYSHTLPIRVCAAQRGRDFEAPGLERGIHFRGVF